MSPFEEISIVAGSILFIVNTVIYIKTLQVFTTSVSKLLYTYAITICTIYPLVCAVALISIVWPKLWLACHTIMHLSFTIGALFFYKLCFKYVGGERKFIADQATNDVMDLRTPPFCCFLSPLTPVHPTEYRLSTVRCLIFQMPLVQSMIMITLNFIYYAMPELYDNIFLFMGPFTILSIISGVWGLNIVTRMINNMYKDLLLMQKFMCLQLILILCKLQYIVLHNLLDKVTFGLNNMDEHSIYKNAIINVIILVEMVPLSLFAQKVYRTPGTL